MSNPIPTPFELTDPETLQIRKVDALVASFAEKIRLCWEPDTEYLNFDVTPLDDYSIRFIENIFSLSGWDMKYRSEPDPWSRNGTPRTYFHVQPKPVEAKGTKLSQITHIEWTRNFPTNSANDCGGGGDAD
jgi:hypothetical protein